MNQPSNLWSKSILLFFPCDLVLPIHKKSRKGDPELVLVLVLSTSSSYISNISTFHDFWAQHFNIEQTIWPWGIKCLVEVLRLSVTIASKHIYTKLSYLQFIDKIQRLQVSKFWYGCNQFYVQYSQTYQFFYTANSGSDPKV